jgi:hypothetical protein
MISTHDKTPNGNMNKPRKRPLPKPPASAAEKAQAVLAVWTERCKPSDVCRQLHINWMTFNHWQNRALEGMLQALESRVNLARGDVLSPRLRELLQKQQRASSVERLQARLQKVETVANPPQQGKLE